MKNQNFEDKYFLSEDSIYKNYKNYSKHPYFKALLNLILKYKNQGGLLELGCGYGLFLKQAEKYFDTYGLDISNYAIKKAMQILKKSELSVTNIESLDNFVDNKKFDIIVGLDIFEHFKNPNKILKLCMNQLNEDGLLIFRVPNKSSLKYNYYKLIRQEKKWEIYKDKTHISVLTLNEWGSLLESNGFKYSILSHIPTKFLQKTLNKYIYWPKIFVPFNTSILFLCKKKI